MTQTTGPSPHPSILNSLNLIVSVFHSYRSPCRPLIDVFPTVHKDDISREQLKELLYEEIMSFNPPPMT